MKSWRNKKMLNYNIKSTNKQELNHMPEEVKNWLSELILLKEVPLSYLVVDKRELPVESIRFFNIDPYWTQALVDGASSIGALTKSETKELMKSLKKQYENSKGSVRISRYGNMHLNHKQENMSMRTDSKTPLSGFIMRSDLVSNWKGIEVKGFMGETNLKIIRLEKLSAKMLICIFEGEIDEVKMYEPKEVLHFGSRSQDREIDIRRIDEGHEGELLYKNEAKVTIKLPTTDNGRLKVNDLRKILSKELNKTVNDIDSPQLALEMLSVAGQCIFERGK